MLDQTRLLAGPMGLGEVGRRRKDVNSLTAHEQQEIDRANEAGRRPVVFVHGLWLLSSSWDRWRTLFEENGYSTLAPGWPDDPETVEEANAEPEVFAHKKIQQVVDHYLEALGQLKTRQ